MWLSKAADSLDRVVRPLSGAFYSVGIGVLAVLMFLTAGDVTLRYVFNRPITGTFDITQFMMAILVSFGLAYCAVKKGHVRVDLVVSHFSKRAQTIIDAITGLFGLGLFSLITWQAAVNMKELWGSGLTSSVLLTPVFPFAGLVALGSACLTLVLLSDFLNFLSEAVKR